MGILNEYNLLMKKAYENLKSYDQGVYRPKRYPSIDKDLKIEDFEEKPN